MNNKSKAALGCGWGLFWVSAYLGIIGFVLFVIIHFIIKAW